jgi:hypothetical protein
MLPWHEVREARECYSRLSALRLLGFVMSGDGDFLHLPGMLRVARWLSSSVGGRCIDQRSSVWANAQIFER